MKTIRLLIITILFLDLSGRILAQEDNSAFYEPQPALTAAHKMNMVKLNLVSPAFLNFSLQYERVINKFLSATVTGRFMPKSTVPYVNSFYNDIFGSSDPAVEEAFKGMKISTYAATVELRFYVSKRGFGKGFYIAPAYRFSRINMSHLVFVYSDYPDVEESLTFSGYSNANYGGFTLGAQWFLGEHLTLDWWLFGPLAGIENAKVDALSTYHLSPDDQQILKHKLESWDMPLTDKTVHVNSQGADLDLHGWMFGYNFGIALGVRF
jgi:hypothetical protein